ncbi:MAG: hypothetical protein IKP75_04185 [Oscillospiraceae bacterium]|nr:hypothetical protein [Oscillospiraceae bacterium]
MASKVNSIEELLNKADAAGMPLEKMRFFIGKDCKEPKCFGVYFDMDSEEWIVYKNKSDGSRAVRYHGPDEAFAAQEIWDKICAEVDIRRDKLPRKDGSGSVTRSGSKGGVLGAVRQYAPFIIFIVVFIIVMILGRNKNKTGYYKRGEDVYYCQNDSWYYLDDAAGWLAYSGTYDDWDDYYYGDSYYFSDSSDSFENSGFYSDSSSDDDDDDYDSYDYDSWDAGDSDWDSDW